MKKLLREPLVHFLALGATLFLVWSWMNDPAGQPSGRIVITTGQIEHLAAGFARTWQRPPTEPELEGLIEDYIRDEVLYQEALALGLERDDTLIRRRLRQKLEFISEDLATQAEPSDQELQSFLEKHPESFAVEPQVAFRHVYLNRDRRGDALVGAAQELLAQLAANDPGADLTLLGDPLLLPAELDLLSQSGIARLFGEEFARQILTLEPDRWAGPIESGYGLHLVFVLEREAGRLPELAEVREAARREWLAARRKEANEVLYRRLRERYTVVVERPKPADSRPNTVAAAGTSGAR